MFKWRKAKKMLIGVNTLSKASDRLKLLDKVLSLFKMHIGANTIELDAEQGLIMSVRLTVYFVR